MLKNNICLQTDSYKIGHYNMYPSGTQRVYSYFEARAGAKLNNMMFFGLQYVLKKHLLGSVVTMEDINNAEKIINDHLGIGVFNRAGWEYILNNHDGRLPVRINAVKEGAILPISNVLMTIENTDENCYWLTNHLETLLSHVWYPCTVATMSMHAKSIISRYLHETSSSSDGVNFMLHDFGYRSASCNEAAGIGGAAHLMNFYGTDTIAGIQCAMDYYGADVCAYSVAATEHSVMTSLGENNDIMVFEGLLEKYKDGILSVVIDSFNWRRFAEDVTTKYKENILRRNGKIVLRPDSGDPTMVTLELLEIIAKNMGYATNDKGYKEINNKVGVLWGDGINIDGMENILSCLKVNKWAASNMVFGMGTGLLQDVNRDIMRFAIKSSAQKRDGEWHDIMKKPISPGKESKSGRLILGKSDGIYKTMNIGAGVDVLKTVFKDGYLLEDYNFNDIRQI